MDDYEYERNIVNKMRIVINSADQDNMDSGKNEQFDDMMMLVSTATRDSNHPLHNVFVSDTNLPDVLHSLQAKMQKYKANTSNQVLSTFGSRINYTIDEIFDNLHGYDSEDSSKYGSEDESDGEWVDASKIASKSEPDLNRIMINRLMTDIDTINNRIKEKGFKTRLPFCVEYMENNVKNKVAAFLVVPNSMKYLPTKDFVKRYIDLFKNGEILITTDLFKYALLETKFNINDMISVKCENILSLSEKRIEITVNYISQLDISNQRKPQIMHSFPILSDMRVVKTFISDELRSIDMKKYPTRAPVQRKIGLVINNVKTANDSLFDDDSLLLKYLPNVFPINCDNTLSIDVYYYFNLERNSFGGNRKRKTLKMRRKQGGNSFHKSRKSHKKRNTKRAKRRNSKGNKTRR